MKIVVKFDLPLFLNAKMSLDSTKFSSFVSVSDSLFWIMKGPSKGVFAVEGTMISGFKYNLTVSRFRLKRAKI